MKTKLLSICLLIFTSQVFAETSLPPCQGSDFNTWTDCYGKYEKYYEKDNFTRIYEGEMKNGKRHGKGISKNFKDNRQTLEVNGFFENGVYLNGTKKTYYKDGGWSTWQGNYNKNNKKHGQGIQTLSNGNKFEGNYDNGAKVYGKYTFSNGDYYIGSFNEKGRFHGEGTYFYSGKWKGDKFVGKYDNNNKVEGTYYSSDNRTRWKQKFKDGKLVEEIQFRAALSDDERNKLQKEVDLANEKYNQSIYCYRNSENKIALNPHIDLLIKLKQNMDSQPLDLLSKSIINQIIGINKNILDIGGC